MTGFVMHLQGASQYRRFEQVESFVGEDPGGAFGLLAAHERFMTPLAFGLAKFRCAGRDWEYLATVGGIAYFVENELYVNSRRFFIDADYETISTKLNTELAADATRSKELRVSLQHIEEAMLRSLWELSRTEGGGL
ncbi:MAG TPA: hypothetical protein VFU76_08150 [Terriglobales bacterium]|nr:hypothetical protein [Terriglobales bacterium]